MKVKLNADAVVAVVCLTVIVPACGSAATYATSEAANGVLRHTYGLTTAQSLLPWRFGDGLLPWVPRPPTSFNNQYNK